MERICVCGVYVCVSYIVVVGFLIVFLYNVYNWYESMFFCYWVVL